MPEKYVKGLLVSLREKRMAKKDQLSPNKCNGTGTSKINGKNRRCEDKIENGCGQV